MSLHIIITNTFNNLEQYKKDYHDVFMVDPSFFPDKQSELARYYWKYKDSKENVAVLTNSDFFTKEINILIMLLNLPLERRLEVLNIYSEYDESMFLSSSLNITCSVLDNNQEITISNLNEYGFEIKLFDDAISLQNRIQDEIYWG